MERKTEKWESLRLEAQKFVPQEYCYVCWTGNLHCDGGHNNAAHWVFRDGETITYGDLTPNGQKHDPHDISVFVRTETNIEPSMNDPAIIEQLKSEGEFHGAIATDAQTYHNHPRELMPGETGEPGWTWKTGEDVHFAFGMIYWSSETNHS